MHKRGQVTIFIIIGILLVVAAGFFFVLRSDGQVQELESELEQVDTTDPASIEAYVRDCLEQTTKDALIWISLQGGYYEEPKLHTELSYAYIPYYYHYITGKDVPNEQHLSNQLQLFIQDYISFCGFEAYEQAGYTVSEREPTATVTLARDQVHVELDYRVRLTLDGQTISLDKVQTTVKSKLLTLYNHAKGVIEKIENDPDYVPTSYIIDLGYENDIKAELIYQDNASVIYSLIDNSTQYPRVFAFAVKYPWHTEGEEVFFEPIQQQEATVLETFSYEVLAYGEDLVFSDSTDLFDVSSDGVINYVPAVDDVGLHNIILTATDSKGNIGHGVMTLRVRPKSNPPVIEDIPPQTAYVGQPFEYTIQATNPSGGVLLYRVESDISQFFHNPSIPTISYTPTAQDIGVHTFNVTVLNLYNEQSKDTFQMSVEVVE